MRATEPARSPRGSISDAVQVDVGRVILPVKVQTGTDVVFAKNERMDPRAYPRQTSLLPGTAALQHSSAQTGLSKLTDG
jgi:hypothetical protein